MLFSIVLQCATKIIPLYTIYNIDQTQFFDIQVFWQIESKGEGEVKVFAISPFSTHRQCAVRVDNYPSGLVNKDQCNLL